MMTAYLAVLGLLDRGGIEWIIQRVDDVPPRKLFWIIGVPAIALFASIQGYRNFISVESPARMLRGSLIGFISCLAGVSLAAALVYNRAWELIAPTEASTQSTFPEEHAHAFMRGIETGATLDPDGQLWAVEFDSMKKRLTRASMPQFTQVGEDKDWQSIITGRLEWLALKQDGTLWLETTETHWRSAMMELFGNGR